MIHLFAAVVSSHLEIFISVNWFYLNSISVLSYFGKHYFVNDLCVQETVF